MLVVVVLMCVTSVLISCIILPRFRSGEFFTFCSLVTFFYQYYILQDGKHTNNNMYFPVFLQAICMRNDLNYKTRLRAVVFPRHSYRSNICV